MPANNLRKAAILALVLVVLTIGSWELYLRSRGVTISYDNSKELWADKRAMVYEPADKTTVFIGSSRIKFDLDIDTWQQTTGRHAVQLAAEGSSPVPILTDLGNDPNFRGRLVVDVTEPIFFSSEHMSLEKPTAYLDCYKKRTPAQKASFVLNHALESWFVFLDQDKYSLNAGLDRLNIPNRPGVFVFPTFPDDFNCSDFDRRSKMTPEVPRRHQPSAPCTKCLVICHGDGKECAPAKREPCSPDAGKGQRSGRQDSIPRR
ncbi:hypothetical protein ACQ86N_08520 [Puia sp. P3]|uniref:hypothetical protein n=1 Tax=Puia sp. P3 TaxID=3423952 RepID=UPI003D67BBA3